MGRISTKPIVPCAKCGKPSKAVIKPTRNNRAGNGKYTFYEYHVHEHPKPGMQKSHTIGPVNESHSSKSDRKSGDHDQKENLLEYWEENEPKISTPKPQPSKSRMYHASAEVANSLLKLSQDWKKLTRKIEQFPPNDTLFDRRVMVRLHRLKKVVDNLNLYIQRLSDERSTNSLLEWISIKMNQEFNPIRAKNSNTMDQIRAGFGLPAVTTEGKKMTKKGINKNLKKNDKRIDDLVDSLGGFELLQNLVLDLSLWRDKKSEFPKAIKGRKDKVSEKQIDSATWRDDAEGTEHLGSFSLDELRDKKRKDKKSKIT
jgi:hypothetical protein